MTSQAPRYHGYRFPPEIISHAVWWYHRFGLSFRDVEDLLARATAGRNAESSGAQNLKDQDSGGSVEKIFRRQERSGRRRDRARARCERCEHRHARDLGGAPGAPLPALRGTKVGKHARAYASGLKAQRRNIRDVPLSRFEKIADVDGLVLRLFGAGETK